MRPFELVEPREVGEAVRLLDTDDPAVRPLGGGTALMLMMKAGFLQPRRLVSLRRLDGRARRIAVDTDGTLRIGAMATLAEIGHAPEVARRAPVIVQALRTLSNVRTRNVATLGGHLAHADPHLDLPPVLTALGARLAIAGPEGERTLPVEALFRGYLETSLRRGEIIVEVAVPEAAGRRAAYLKCTARSADDWPTLGVAVALGDRDARIVVGAATETPMRLTAAEAVLGAARDAAGFARAGEAAAETRLVADQHGSAAYKKELLRVYVRRALAAACG